MAKVSITKAAKLAGISRSHFYKAYIDTGAISLSKDEKDKPYIDTSELLRVFGVLTEDTSKTGHKTAPEDSTAHPENTGKNSIPDPQKEISRLEQQLEEARTREAWYQGQIQNLTDTMKLLESPKTPAPRWWPFWK